MPLRFEDWLGLLPQGMDRSGRDYDLRGAYAAGLMPGENGHLPDLFKLPNHPTFSDGSRYSVPGQMGGHWTAPPPGTGPDGWTYAPSPDQLRDPAYAPMIQDYFARYEPRSILSLPLPPIGGR